MTRMTFRDNEQRCEQTFLNAGHWWHLYTPGKETPLIFKDDGDFLTDQEIFTELLKLLNEHYDGCKISALSNAQKLDLAKILHFKYHSSNGQIRRILGISQYQITQLFNN